MKKMYVDIGELGWSLYLSAHVRWLRQHTTDYIGIMTHADRRCLYNGIADAIYGLPNDFYIKYRRDTEVYFGLKGTSNEDLKNYFTKQLPAGYELRGNFGPWKQIREKTIFKPYVYDRELNGRKEILVFPRCRNMERPGTRNLPGDFYTMIINTLCDKFPTQIIRTIGIPSGSYSIDKIKKTNYINDVQQDADLQSLIDRCQVAMVAIGSQSAPPKITLLQGVPTFMIGHQKARHIGPDNWMSTKVDFYDVPKENYASINIEDCINRIIAFVESCQW